MKSLFQKGNLFLLLLCFSISNITSAQVISRELILPYRAQLTENWCWAASMQMIIDFHQPDSADALTQCELVKELYKLNDGYQYHSLIDGLDCCTNCTFGHPDTIPNSMPCSSTVDQTALLLQTLLYNYQGVNPIKARPDNYDLIFSTWGFSSIQQINRDNAPMEWDQIKQQIKECQPFIINVQDAPNNEVTGNHALVVKGYQEVINGTVDTFRYVLTNDPWRPCCDTMQEALFPYDVFTQTNTNMNNVAAVTPFVSNVQSTIHTIQTGTVFEALGTSDCTSCNALDTIYAEKSYLITNEPDDTNTSFNTDHQNGNSKHQGKLVSFNLAPEKVDTIKKNKPSVLFQILDKYRDNVLGYGQTAFKNDQFQEEVKRPGYFHAPVVYVSSSLLNRSDLVSRIFPPGKLYKVSIPGPEIVEVLHGNIPGNVASTFQKDGDGPWRLRKITTYSNLRGQIPVDIEKTKQEVILSNRLPSNSAANEIHFQLVKYYPFQYEFLYFSLNGKEYMAPTGNYQKELGLNPFTAYKEATVLKTLRKDTRHYENTIKDTYPDKKTYKTIVDGLKDLLPTQQPDYSLFQITGSSTKSN